MDRHGPHNALLDGWVRMHQAAAHAIKVAKGDNKQEGTSDAARFDANTIVDILCEHANGRQVGVELKCLHIVRSTYGKDTQGSHCDNGHLYGFGNRLPILATAGEGGLHAPPLGQPEQVKAAWP